MNPASRAYVISLLILVLLVGILAKTKPGTAAEMFPLASAVGWVEGNGRALGTDFIGTGIRPAQVVKIGRNFIPRTTPVLMMYYGAVTRVYSEIVDRPLDGADIPMLSWLVNFLGILPWALFLFGGLVRLAKYWGCEDGTKPVWAAWAVIAGSLAFQWFGTMSPFLPVTALSVWVLVLLFEFEKKQTVKSLVIAAILAGISGMFHPSGWLWLIFGLFYLFVSTSESMDEKRQMKNVVIFGITAFVPVIIALVLNYLFFGTLLPVQMIDLQPITMAPGRIIQLIWHDIIGWNGLIWLSPLVVTGIFVMLLGSKDITGGSIVLFLVGMVAVILLVWGIGDDARLIAENESIRAEFLILPIELNSGRFQMVQLPTETGGYEEQQAFYERLFARTDVFLWTGGRSAGIPVFLPVAVILAILGWCRANGSVYLRAWNWAGVRFGGLLGLIISQAPYGAASELYLQASMDWVAQLLTHTPVLEAILAVSLRLAELWPSSVVKF